MNILKREAREPARIMVVDDQPANLRLMESLLRKDGYTVRSFPLGRLALKAAAGEPPDLILLDINMPEMDGFEVCQWLKADVRLAPIPVIFLSALDAAEDKVRGFRCGGVDYITKPFQVEEVQARVRTHLELHRLHQELQQYSGGLEELVRARTRELTEAQERLQFLDAAKSDFLALISHELNTPLNGLLGIGGLVLEMLPDSPEAEEFRDMFEQARQRIVGITENALLLTQIQVEAERFQPRSMSLQQVVRQALHRAAVLANGRQVAMAVSPAADIAVLGNEELLVKAIQSLLETGVKFSKPGQTATVSYQTAEEAVQVRIESEAGRIPAGAAGRFFDIFAIREAMSPGGEMGLEPAIACRILKLFGGQATVENREPAGICITASIPFSSPSNIPRPDRD